MGANIALLRHLYDVSIDTKLHVNEQTICNFYKFNDNEQYATVVVTMWLTPSTILARLKDRDYDVTPHIILILSLIFAPNP